MNQSVDLKNNSSLASMFTRRVRDPMRTSHPTPLPKSVTVLSGGDEKENSVEKINIQI